MKFDSVRFELSIIHTAVIGTILVIFSVVLYLISQSYYKQIDRQLISKAQAVDHAMKAYQASAGSDTDALVKAAQKMLAMKAEGLFSMKFHKVTADWVKEAQALSLNKDYILIIKRNGNVLSHSSNMDSNMVETFMDNAHLRRGVRILFRGINYRQKIIRLIVYPAGGDPKGDYLIQIGYVQGPLVQQVRNFLYSIMIVLPMVLILMNYIGRKQTQRILDPVYQITAMADRITHHDLSARIKDQNFKSEMRMLITAFNDMIARLENSFKHIEEFSHHVAHELKTPLTIIRGEADLMLRKERSKEEYQRALNIVLEESARVLKTIDDLLLMAKLDYQPEAFSFDRFNFSEFLYEVCLQLQMLADQKKVTINLYPQPLDPLLMVDADRLHLRRLFFNVIDNAIKFTPAAGRIEVNVAADEGKIVTSIKDDGPGISAEHQSLVFEKFYRLDYGVIGNGLGLSIAGAIAKIHQGTITVESLPGVGCTFKIILPQTSAAAA